MTFQNKVNLGPATGWNGDFATTNSRVTLLGTEGGYFTGEEGVNAGSFVWLDAATQTLLSHGETPPDGFVGRELTGVTLPYMQEYSMVIPAGVMVTVFEKGEFFITLPKTITTVARGDIVYASKKTGLIVAANDTDAVATSYKYATKLEASEETSVENGDTVVAISAWI